MKRIFCLLISVIISAGVTGCAEAPAAGINDSEEVVPVESVEIVVEEVVPVEGVEIVVGGDEEVQKASENMTADSADETSVSEIDDLPSDMEETYEYTVDEKTHKYTVREGSYEYKGFIFKGRYTTRMSPSYNENMELIEVSDTSFSVDINSLSEEPGLSLYNAAFDIATLFYCNDVEGIKKYFDNEEDYANGISPGVLTGYPAYDTLPSLAPYCINVNEITVGDVYFAFYFLTDYGPNSTNPDIDLIMFLNKDNEWKVNSVSFSK